MVSQAQSKQNLEVVDKIIELNRELEFVEMAKLFDTTDGRKLPPAFLLHSAWTYMRDNYGHYVKSYTKKAYTKKDIEYILQEFEFDSGYVTLKIGFTADHKVTTYMMKENITKADRLLEEKYRLPAYANPKLVTTQNVSFGQAPFIMEGELTLPKNITKDKPVPAVVLIHGSGANNRDSKNGPQQPFRDIAYGLSTRGIAVLRYDKRTYTYPEECAADTFFTITAESILDALEGVKFLKNQPGIAPNKIFVLGHSLGGMVLPRLAMMDSVNPAGLIFMAAPAMPLPDKIIEQCDYLAKILPDKKDTYEKQKEEFIRLKTQWYDSATPAKYMPFGAGPIYWMDLENYHQTEVAKKVHMPMLILQGGRDYQVTTEDFELWKKALDGRKNAQFRLFSSLNHMMVTGIGASNPDEYKIPGNVNLEVIETIEGWIKAR